MDMRQSTKIILAWELYEQAVPQTHIAKQLGINRDTVRVWVSSVKTCGLTAFLETHAAAKKGPRLKRQVDPLLKRRIWEIREREFDCCGQKIAYFLKKDYGMSCSVPKIYEVLKEKYVIRSKWKKNQKRGPVPKANKPREVVQMDTIDFGELFAFTGIDIFTKEADVFVTSELTSLQGEQFLDHSMKRRFNGFVDLLQADGGPEFKDHFKAKVHTYCNRYRVARPYRKNEQSFIESFNRTVRKECLGWQKYRHDQLDDCQKLVESFLERYHYHRPHMSLNMLPPLST